MFKFPLSDIKDLNYSFSGIKTAVLYFIEEKTRENPNFIQENLEDICVRPQHAILEMLLKKLTKARKFTKFKDVAIVG